MCVRKYRETKYSWNHILSQVSTSLSMFKSHTSWELSVCLFTLSFLRVLPPRLATPKNKVCLCQHSDSCCSSVLRVLEPRTKKLFKTRQTNKRNVELKEVGTRRANRNDCHFEGNRRTSWSIKDRRTDHARSGNWKKVWILEEKPVFKF